MHARVPDRYVPELVSLCVKKIATHARIMNKKQRYNYLSQIPKHLIPFVKCFPTDFVVWVFDQGFQSSIDMLSFFKDKPDTEWLLNEYTKECEYGIPSKRFIDRKCPNYYCDETVCGPIISKQHYIRLYLCNVCNSYRMKRWFRFKKAIRTHLVE